MILNLIRYLKLMNSEAKKSHLVETILMRAFKSPQIIIILSFFVAFSARP